MSVSLDDVIRIVGLQLGIKKISPEDHLRESLGAESLDMQNIIMALEDKYLIRIPDEDSARLETVNDCYNLVQARV